MNQPIVTLNTLPETPPFVIAALPVEQLVNLVDEAEERLRQARSTKETLENAIAQRYGDRTALVRQQNDKPTGVVRFNDGPFVVIADLPKKPEWDQEKLATIVEQIKNAGNNPLEYIEISYRVSETRYNAWPAAIRQAFEPSRTLKLGKPTFKIELPAGRGGF